MIEVPSGYMFFSRDGEVMLARCSDQTSWIITRFLLSHDMGWCSTNETAPAGYDPAIEVKPFVDEKRHGCMFLPDDYNGSGPVRSHDATHEVISEEAGWRYLVCEHHIKSAERQIRRSPNPLVAKSLDGATHAR